MLAGSGKDRDVLAALVLAAMFWVTCACSGGGRPAPLQSEPRPDAGVVVPPNDCPGIDDYLGDRCGTEVIPFVLPRRNLYFVLDRSGSMGEPLPGTRYDKYTGARVAIDQLLRDIGHRVHYGGAVFPGKVDELGCAAGLEVFPVAQGDALEATCQSGPRKTLDRFQTALAHFSTIAGTPVGPTLSALAPTLLGLEGQTSVILATDGAPNCNPEARCEIADCLLNVEGATVKGRRCDETFNCCDPDNVPQGPTACVDAEGSLAAVSALRQAGVATYVIGMPGSELYESVLSQLAAAGGTARAASPSYYAASDVDELTALIREIGGAAGVSCQIELARLPQNPALVNLYVDGRLLPASPENGWAFLGPQTLEIFGETCEALKLGDVRQVEILFGCPTMIE
jgi:hypothetical protein